MSTSTTTTPQTLTVRGSCHCGKITYTATIPTPTPSAPLSAYRCNCTCCQKPNFTSLRLDPKDFNLLAPASRAEMGDYVYRSPDIHRYFCTHCGVQVYGQGRYKGADGEWVEFLSVNVSTVDQPQDGVDLRDVKVGYLNGLVDRQGVDGLGEVPFSGGMI